MSQRFLESQGKHTQKERLQQLWTTSCVTTSRVQKSHYREKRSSFTKSGKGAQVRSQALQKDVNKFRQDRKFKAHLARTLKIHVGCSSDHDDDDDDKHTVSTVCQAMSLIWHKRYIKGKKGHYRQLFLRNKNSHSKLLLKWINWLILQMF